MDTLKVKKSKSFFSGKFYAAPVIVEKNCVLVKLPIGVAKYFELNKPEIYWAPVNGVIQLSSSEPHMVIPLMSLSVDKFIPQ